MVKLLFSVRVRVAHKCWLGLALVLGIRVRVTDKTPVFAIAPLKLHVSPGPHLVGRIG